jgi:hypothetical protein
MTMKPKNARTSKALVAEHSTGEHQDRIRQRAYELWEASGCPQGCEVEHWLQAERELSALEVEPATGRV